MGAGGAYEKKKQAWLDGRMKGIGASEASAVVGANPYMSNVDLWKIKTGRMAREDISHKPHVKYGLDAEKPLRELFALDHPEYKVSYRAFDVARHKGCPWLFATLDGRLTDKATGERGVLEIKTTEILSSMAKERWREDLVPQNYFIQCLHQLLATGYSFAILKAQLKYVFPEGGTRLLTRHYQWRREDVADDLEYLLGKETEFWQGHVLAGREPPLLLPEI